MWNEGLKSPAQEPGNEANLCVLSQLSMYDVTSCSLSRGSGMFQWRPEAYKHIKWNSTNLQEQ